MLKQLLYLSDLNPIKNLWELLKKRIIQQYPELLIILKNAKSLKLLCEATIKVWYDFDKDLINGLIDLMPRRVAVMVIARGQYTKYQFK